MDKKISEANAYQHGVKTVSVGNDDSGVTIGAVAVDVGAVVGKDAEANKRDNVSFFSCSLSRSTWLS